VKARAYLAGGASSEVATARYVIESDGGNDTTPGLEINAALGISVIASPLASEQAVDGLVTVELDGEDPPTGTTLTLNGTPLVPWLGSASIFTVDEANVPAAAPGNPITLVAAAGGKTSTLALACPGEPGWGTTPAAGAALRATSAVSSNWTGDIYFNPAMAGFGMMQSSLSIRPYDSAGNRAYGFAQNAQTAMPVSPAKTASVIAGDSDGHDSYLLQFDVIGPFTTTDNGDGGEDVGVCITVSRKIFTAQE
jgi:hypothetical protein